MTRFALLSRGGWLLAAVSALSLFAPTAAAAASPSAPTLIVRVYDAFGAKVDELDRARAVFEQVFDATDVQVRWRHCRSESVDPCDERLQDNELVIRLIRGPVTDTRVPSQALGYSALHAMHQRGTLATVFPDRVRTLAQRAGWAAGDLLGNAIAHEVGHLLLGSTSHADDGLMRPHWTARDTRNSVPRDWAFQDREREPIRAAVYGRASGRPVGVPTARVEPPPLRADH